MILDGLVKNATSGQLAMTNGIADSLGVKRRVDRMDFNLENQFLFSNDFVALIDVMIMRDSMNILSRNQQKLMKMYFIQADTETLEGSCLQLDKFLGEYNGEQ